MEKNKLRVLMVVWFYIGWFGCVFLGQADLGLLSVFFPIVSWFLLSKVFPLHLRRVYVLVGLTILGLVFDSGMAWFQAVRFEPPSVLTPVWLVSIWFLFSGILPLTREVFGKRLWLAAILGAIFGPLSYLSGEAFGVMFFNHTMTVWLFAAFWAIYFPLCLIAQKESQV